MIPQKVVLLVNLGSPQELNLNSISRFLKRFLLDKRVVNLPHIFWKPLLLLRIIPKRKNRLLDEYRLIFTQKTNNESPIYYYTKKQAHMLSTLLSSEYLVDYAFSYSSPLIIDKLEELNKNNLISELIILPLYPEYSSTTVAPIFDTIAKFYKTKLYIPKLVFHNNFAHNENYIKVLAAHILANIDIKNNKLKHLIFSFHGIPEVLVNNGDSYLSECSKTVSMVMEQISKIDINISHSLCFQSKFGKGKWLEPNLTQELDNIAKIAPKTDVYITCPGFVSDCLETLFEIKVQNSIRYKNNGGFSYTYIPCLNDNEEFIHSLVEIIRN